MKNFIIYIEGNIGAGKSTVIRRLKQYFKNNTNCLVQTEPVSNWPSLVSISTFILFIFFLYNFFSIYTSRQNFMKIKLNTHYNYKLKLFNLFMNVKHYALKKIYIY